jgi:hypothetical protein
MHTCVIAGYVNFVVHDFIYVIIQGCCLNIRVYVDRLLHGSTFLLSANVSFIFVQANLVTHKKLYNLK